MARGQDTRHHPGRKAANWQPRPGNVSNSRGNVIASRSEGEGEYTHNLEVTQHSSGSPGFSADLDLVRSVNRGGIETEQYQAGPYKTQRRAEIAGDALLNRAEAGKRVEDYQIGEYYESADEIRANRAGLL